MRAFAAGLVAAVVIAAGSLAAAPAGQQQEKPKEAAVAADAISGDWDGTVLLPDGPIPFFLKLKLENEKVTGDIGSDMGSVPLSGTFTDGKLALAFVYVNGEPISMNGEVKDDQASGQLDMGGGQMVTTWTAKKKKT